jgi:hypothetical protein
MIRHWLAVYAWWIGSLCAALVALAVAVSVAVLLRRRVAAPVDEPDVVAEMFGLTAGGQHAAPGRADWRPAHTAAALAARGSHHRGDHNARWRPDLLVEPTKAISTDSIARAFDQDPATS